MKLAKIFDNQTELRIFLNKFDKKKTDSLSVGSDILHRRL